jgi:rare lipoprotein A
MNVPMKFRISLFLCCFSAAALAQQQPAADARPEASKKARHNKALDHSGKPRKGKASYYGRKFYGKKMADGTPMNPQSNVAASKTLPLGTKAEVTNLENGKSEVVEIKDRGPYVEGRIIDLSPKTADKLDIKEQGVARVEVKPIAIPQPDGSVKEASDIAQDDRKR